MRSLIYSYLTHQFILYQHSYSDLFTTIISISSILIALFFPQNCFQMTIDLALAPRTFLSRGLDELAIIIPLTQEHFRKFEYRAKCPHRELIIAC